MTGPGPYVDRAAWSREHGEYDSTMGIAYLVARVESMARLLVGSQCRANFGVRNMEIR